MLLFVDGHKYHLTMELTIFFFKFCETDNTCGPHKSEHNQIQYGRNSCWCSKEIAKWNNDPPVAFMSI